MPMTSTSGAGALHFAQVSRRESFTWDESSALSPGQPKKSKPYQIAGDLDRAEGKGTSVAGLDRLPSKYRTILMSEPLWVPSCWVGYCSASMPTTAPQPRSLICDQFYCVCRGTRGLNKLFLMLRVIPHWSAHLFWAR
jgi:hypothetical protein